MHPSTSGPTHQYSLTFIEHHIEHSVVKQRASDGYISASALCEAAGKSPFDYLRQAETHNFLQVLATKTGISLGQLIQHRTADAGEEVWVHPKVAVHLAQWLSADFAVAVSEWVYEWLSGERKQPRTKLPPHIERHMLNVGKVPSTHFSILQEMTMTLIAPLEAQGYTLPEDMVPDISQGRMFCKFARETLGLDTDALPTYDHEYPDGRTCPAKLYPVEHLSAFRTYINQVWMPQRAEGYFKERDPQALPLLDKLLKISMAPPRLPPMSTRPTKRSKKRA